MADTPTGETVTPGDSQTTVTTTSTPPQDNASAAEVERLRKEKEQLEMRANQLKNELDAKEKTDEEARQKQLEENNEWKTIAEQNQAKLDAFEKEREEAVAKLELEKSQSEVFGEFPQEVVELAKDTELGLSENSEEAKTKLREKLQKLQERTSSTVKPNNPPSPGNTKSKEELLQEYATSGRESVQHQVIGELNWVKAQKARDAAEE